jgi:hypothetical protein
MSDTTTDHLDDDIFDDLFQGCALAAYLDQTKIQGSWPPDSEATRRLAYRYYEEALAEKNGSKPNPIMQETDPLTSRVTDIKNEPARRLDHDLDKANTNGESG